MSLEFMDGFDHQGPVTQKWDTTSNVGFTAGRFGGYALSFGTFSHADLMQGQLSAVATRTVGFAMLHSGLVAGNKIIQFMDTTEQLSVRVGSGGSASTLIVSRNGTTLATSTQKLIQGIWVYLQFQATIGSSGSYTLKVTVGGTTSVWLTASGVNTQATANATTNGLVVADSNGNNFWTCDDFYVLNSSGSANNDFLGESRILTILPSADDTASPGTNLLWRPNSGTSHFSSVNEVPPNGDTSYVSSATAGQIDTYKYPSISPTGSILAVQANLCQRKDDTGARTTCVEYRGGGTNFDGSSTFSPGSDYFINRQIYETDPATGAAWTASGINNGEFGIKCLS